jgi:hypothetical protein
MEWTALENQVSQNQSMEIDGNRWKSMEIDGNRWKSMEIDGNRWKSMEIDGNDVFPGFPPKAMSHADIICCAFTEI